MTSNLLNRRGSLLLAAGGLTALALGVQPTQAGAKPAPPKGTPGHPDNNTAMFDSGFIRSGLPLDAWAHLTMRRNGDYTFATHVHDSGADKINYTISAVLVTAKGIVFTFQHSGHTGGLVGGSRNSNYTNPASNNPIIAREFDGIFNGAVYKVRLDATDALAKSMGNALKDLAKTALADPRAIVAKNMVALITQ